MFLQSFPLWQRLLQSISFFLHGHLLVLQVPKQLYFAAVMVEEWEYVDQAADGEEALDEE